MAAVLSNERPWESVPERAGFPLHIKYISQLMLSENALCEKREATHLADRQAHMGWFMLLSCSQLMGGLPFQSRRDWNCTLSPTYHLSVVLVPSSTQRFIDGHLIENRWAFD